MVNGYPAVPGTPKCWRLFDRSTEPPFYARCVCGWSKGNLVSHRDEKRTWHAHVRAVRRSMGTM